MQKSLPILFPSTDALHYYGESGEPSVFGDNFVMNKNKPFEATHHLSNHPLYWVWRSVKARCYNPKAKGYERYGGNGVIMCDEWLSDFKAFYDWCMANGWQKRLQLDKDIKAKELGLIPNLYSPDRCSIVTPKRNSNSRKSNRILEFNGRKLTISQWSDETGIPRNAIRMRIEQHGYSIEEALTSPMFKPRKQRKCIHIEYNGINKPLSYWAKELNTTPKDIARSLKSGKTFEQIYNRYKYGKKRKDSKR